MATYRLGELFCGPGGIACGAMNAKIENPDFKIVPDLAAYTQRANLHGCPQ